MKAIKAFFKKISKDNVGVLASIVSWSVLTSLIPILVGLIAISGLILRKNPSAQTSVISHLSSALQGVLTKPDLESLVKASVQHTGLLGIVGFVGILWGGANVGGAISTVFQAVFEVKGRNFIIEKLIDMLMIFVFAILMIIIIVATTAGAVIKRLFTGFPLPGAAAFAIGIAVSILAGFLLFASIYTVFPNVRVRFKMGNVWRGALTAAILLQILSLIFPIYAKFAHFSKYGSLLGSIVLLTAWIYFFSMVMLVGAEVVAVGAIREAERRGEGVGPSPEPEETVPQHTVLRGSEEART